MTAEPFHAFAVAESKGSVNPYVNWTDIERYEFDLPPIDEQKRLAALLWAMEDYREAQNDLEERIIELRRTAFEAAAFKAAATSLSAWIDRIDAGRSPQAASEPAADDEFGVLKVSAIGGHDFISTENKRLLTQTSFVPEMSVRAGDILVTRANAVVDNVARPCMVDCDHPNLMLSDKTLRLVPKSGIPPRIILAALQSPEYRIYVREVVNGTEAKNITQQKILAGPIPDLQTQQISLLWSELTALDSAAFKTAKEPAAVKSLRASMISSIFGGA